MTAAVAPVAAKRSQDLADERERRALISQLKRFGRMSRTGEGSRVASDVRGAKLYNDRHYEEGPMAGKLQITSNQAVALYERLAASVTRNKPLPMIEPVNEANEDGAMLLEGVVQTNWRTQNMQDLIKRSRRLVGFTRPDLWYVWWDQRLRGGIGDFTTRIIPGYRCIIDDRKPHVRQMEYAGFWESATRAQWIQLFPDKTKEIEDAIARQVEAPPGQPKNPLKPQSGPIRGGYLDRLVADDPGNPSVFQGTTSVRYPGARGKRELWAEEVTVEFLWIKDPTPKKVIRPAKSAAGKPMHDVVRSEETGEIEFDISGYTPVQTPLGMLFSPVLTPRTRPRMVEEIDFKYQHLRHIAWIPHDEIILWDVAWNGPIPLCTDRDSFALDGYWKEGKALRLCSLNVARNLFLSIVFERLRLSLSGTWIAETRSGLKRNKLIPETGVVYQVNNIQGIKEFPVNPIDAAYLQMLDICNNEMMNLLGVSQVMQGQPAGRADSPQTYDALIEQSSTSIVDDAQLLEQTITEWTEIAIWFAQNYYTHEHVVECETVDGGADWRSASGLAMRGQYAVRVETGSMLSMSESQQFARAQQYAALGIYALPMLCKMGHVPHWRRALRQKMAIAANPQYAQVLMGASGGTPAQAGMTARASVRRSHHAPGR